MQHYLLYEHQYGFQKGKNTEHNLLHVINYVSKALNSGEYCIGIFFDLKKAFDVVSHKILLKKLAHLGVRGTALNWFKSYLSNRKQKTEVNGSLSTENNIDISVLQGSILGPILFLCFINDLHLATDLFSSLFADDTCCLKSHKNLDELISYVNTEIHKIALWFKSNKLAVNVSKTKFILFRTRGKKVNISENAIVYNENELNDNDPSLITPLERIHNNNVDPNKRSYKLLGVHLDEFLSLDHHIKYLCNKLSRSIYCIKRAQNFITLKALKTLYFALINSHLNYCPIVLSITSKQNLNQISKIQKKAIRVVTRQSYNTHTNPLFYENKILPFNLIIKKAQASLMHSIEFNYAPLSYQNIWPKNNDRNLAYNLRNPDNYVVPAPNLEFFKRMPLFTLPTLWNNLPDFKFHDNKFIFQRLLRELLFNEIYMDLAEQ